MSSSGILKDLLWQLTLGVVKNESFLLSFGLCSFVNFFSFLDFFLSYFLSSNLVPHSTYVSLSSTGLRHRKRSGFQDRAIDLVSSRINLQIVVAMEKLGEK